MLRFSLGREVLNRSFPIQMQGSVTHPQCSQRLVCALATKWSNDQKLLGIKTLCVSELSAFLTIKELRKKQSNL